MSKLLGDVETIYPMNLTMRERMKVEGGVLDREALVEAKQKLMKFAMDYLKEELIEVKHSFVDRGGNSEVDLTIDAVVITGDDWRRLSAKLERIEAQERA